ncbi:hypothetical protein SCLCIDRAFT_47469, partial [Scleroderma citrinum Foug A]
AGCPTHLQGGCAEIMAHLRAHGISYRMREQGVCPWLGCGKSILWKNVSRHVREKHLGIR